MTVQKGGNVQWVAVVWRKVPSWCQRSEVSMCRLIGDRTEATESQNPTSRSAAFESLNTHKRQTLSGMCVPATLQVNTTGNKTDQSRSQRGWWLWGDSIWNGAWVHGRYSIWYNFNEVILWIDHNTSSVYVDMKNWNIGPITSCIHVN